MGDLPLVLHIRMFLTLVALWFASLLLTLLYGALGGGSGGIFGRATVYLSWGIFFYVIFWLVEVVLGKSTKTPSDDSKSKEG